MDKMNKIKFEIPKDKDKRIYDSPSVSKSGKLYNKKLNFIELMVHLEKQLINFKRTYGNEFVEYTY